MDMRQDPRLVKGLIGVVGVVSTVYIICGVALAQERSPQVKPPVLPQVKNPIQRGPVEGAAGLGAFRKKWGYDSATAVPKAELWVLTDSAIVPPDVTALRTMEETTTIITPMPTSGSALASSDKDYKPDPGYAVFANPKSPRNVGGTWGGSAFDPMGAPLKDCEAQVDLLLPVPGLVFITASQGGTVYALSGPRVGAGKNFKRVSIGGLTTAKWKLVGGEGPHPFETGKPFEFGLKVYLDEKGEVGVDNFEVYIATGCDERDKERERKAKQNKDQDKAKMFALIQGIKPSGSGPGGDAMSAAAIQRERGSEKPPTSNIVGTECCNDSEPVMDGAGNMVIDDVPEDSEVTATANFVEEEVPLEDVFTGADTRTDDWLGQLPCSPSVGAVVPQEVLDLEAMPEDKFEDSTTDVDKETQGVVEETEGKEVDSDPTNYPDLTTTNLVPTPSWVTGIGKLGDYHPTGKVAFGGRDVVYVHGLKLSHIFDGLVMNRPYARMKWTDLPGSGSNALYAANRSYFPSTNPATLYMGHVDQPSYLGDLAFKNWIGDNTVSRANLTSVRGLAGPFSTIPGLQSEPNFPVDGHVGQFLFANGYQNRFMIASYNCFDRLDSAVRAFLTQVGMAMSDGIGVYNPGVVGGLKPVWNKSWPGVECPNPQFRAFGANGLVFISQSTGALLVDVSMSRGATTPQWNVQWIPAYGRVHLSAQGADGGSHIASVANAMRYLPDGAVKFLAKKIYTDDKDPMSTGVSRHDEINQLSSTDIGRIQQELPGTIIMDLRPEIVFQRHRQHVNATPVPTLTMAGGHPTTIAMMKYWLQPGFDDNTINTAGTVAGRTHWMFWPFGSLAAAPLKNFDLGLFGPNITIPKITGPFGLITVQLGTTYAGQPLRALGFYMDQRIDPKFTGKVMKHMPGIRDHFQASAASPFKSPSGMIQDVVPMFFTPWDPYWRANNHFGFLSASADHFEATHDQGMGAEVRPSGAFPGEEVADIHYPDYTETMDKNPKEWNQEESTAFTSLLPWLPSEAAGPATNQQVQSAYPGMFNKPLLKLANFPHVWLTRGCYIEITAKWPKKKPKWKKTWTIWFFKRHYDLLKGWRSKMQFDYVYGTELGGQPLGGVLVP